MRTLSERFGRLLGCGAILVVLLMVAPVQAQDNKPIKVLMPNKNSTLLYPAIVARELGLFEDEGLDVTLLAPDTNVALLMDNQVDLVMLDAPQMFQAVNARQPVAVVFEAMQYAPEVMVVREDSPIQSVADLKGKTIGLAGDRDLITAQVALDTVGVTIDEVETVVVGDSGPVLARSVRDNEVDAVAAAINDVTVLEANGIRARDITPPEVSENPANSFVINKHRTEELRPTVEAFLRAWAKGAEAAKLDRDGVAAMARRHSVPAQWEVEANGQALLDGAMKRILPQTPKHGQPQPEVWTAIQGPYIKFDVIEGEVDPATFIDASFYEAANDFDPAEVKAAIDEWKAANPDLLKP